jgi:threonine dehydrogenase-like Zn-dependent dehydrogenase
MHPHQDYVIVPESSLTLVPETIPAQRAVLISNMETAVNAIWDSGLTIGNRVLVCGFGIVGALIAMLANQVPAVKVYVLETNLFRRQMAATLGFGIIDPKTAGAPAFDLAFNTTASSEALQVCIDYTLRDSKIIEVSWYGTKSATLALGTSFHTGHKHIISSQVSAIPPSMNLHFDFKRRKEVVLDLLSNELFDLLPFHSIPFEQLPQLFMQIRNHSYNQFSTIVKY